MTFKWCQLWIWTPWCSLLWMAIPFLAYRLHHYTANKCNISSYALMSHTCMFTACSSSPCLHDGTCILDSSYTYHCACLAGYTGKRCENGESLTKLKPLRYGHAWKNVCFLRKNGSGERKNACRFQSQARINQSLQHTVGMTWVFHLLEHLKDVRLTVLTLMKSKNYWVIFFWNQTHLVLTNESRTDFFLKAFFFCCCCRPESGRWFTVTREKSVVWTRFRPAAFPVCAVPSMVWSINFSRHIK